jgi:acyl-CoA synthetase (NDP forming)
MSVIAANIFSPRSIALVGATEKAIWTHALAGSFEGYGYKGDLFAVNSQGRDVLGYPGYRSCTEIPGGIDAAYVLVPVHAMEEAVRDLVAAGARLAVILTSGFAETGEEGRALERHIVQIAQEGGLVIFGPNSLGFADIARRMPLTTLQPRLLDGGVALVSQSGATANELLDIADRHHVGLSFVAATGNEAMVGLADLIDYLLDHSETRVIGVYLETIRDAERLREAAARALARGKPVVVLKVGQSPLTASIAAAHTGALVGDDRVFDAACERLGMVRVRTVEDLILTCGFLADNRHAKSRRIGVVSTSGGACAMIADLAANLNIELPALQKETVDALRACLPSYAATLNPLDITGASTVNLDLFTKSIEAVGQDPNIDAVYVVFPLPATQADARLNPFPAIGKGAQAVDVTVAVWTQSLQPVTGFAAGLLEEAGVPFVLNGLEAGLRAISNAALWYELRGRAGETPPAGKITHIEERPDTERATLDHLARFDVPVVPTLLATCEGEAVAAARSMGGPVVLKISSQAIAHKTEVGGVILNLTTPDQVAQGYRQIMSDVRAKAPAAPVEGIIVAPMRSDGLELVVGVARDPFWGPVLAVGFGGVLVELLQDSALCLLPVGTEQIKRMLRSLRGAALLDGYRGSGPVDMDKLALAIAQMGDAALALGPDLSALEVNPLRLSGERIEALDALAVFADSAAGEVKPEVDV